MQHLSNVRILYGSRDVTIKQVELRLSGLRKAVSGYSSLLHSFGWLTEQTGFHLKVFLPARRNI